MPKRNNKEKMAFDDWFVMNYARLKESIGLMSVLMMMLSMKHISQS